MTDEALTAVQKYPEVAKSQWVRIWDCAGMVPALMYIGASNKHIDQASRAFLVMGGFGTLLYNFHNLMDDRGTEHRNFSKIPLGVSSVYYRDAKDSAMGNAMRIFDVVGFGPWCIFIAARYKLPIWQEVFLWSTGIMTILVNAANWWANHFYQDRLPPPPSTEPDLIELKGLKLLVKPAA